jgi:alpha-1,2-mannosyltransferase
VKGAGRKMDRQPWQLVWRCAAALASTGLLGLAAAVCFARTYFVRLRRRRRRQQSAARGGDGGGSPAASACPTVAFLHPECLSGGGGERVLWVAVFAVRSALPHARIAICAPWPAEEEGVAVLASTRKRVAAQFRMDVPAFEPVRVRGAGLASASRYPRFTLLLQALGAAALGLEAYAACAADVFVDTANQAFALVPAKALGAVTVTYIHYPTVSADMLAVVRGRRGQFNNDGAIARSRVLSAGKLAYYRAFAALYSAAGRAADVVMVNSSWTRGHVAAIWRHTSGGALATVFPPCDTSLLSSLPIDGARRTRGLIVSVGQFRPEKDHMLQLEVMSKLLNTPAYAEEFASSAPSPDARRPRLIMIGGARHAGDAARVRALHAERARLGLEGAVELRVNASWEELFEVLSAASAGLHTMRDEHFGISVVELQAAGAVPVAHRSGGVAADIIEDGVSGFLADGADDYARRLHQVLTGSGGVDVPRMRRAARARAARFSDDAFVAEFAAAAARAAARAQV